MRQGLKLISWFYFIPHLFELLEIARYTGELQYDTVGYRYLNV